VALPELVVATKGPFEPPYDRECEKYLLVLFKEKRALCPPDKWEIQVQSN